MRRPALWRIVGWILLSIAFLFSFNLLSYDPLAVRALPETQQAATNPPAQAGYADLEH